MKVFYTASFKGKTKYQKNYDVILHAIKETGVELLATEDDSYSKILKGISQKPLKNILHYQAIKKGIEWADAIIMENSEEDFQLGHEATLAIINKKPVLCLSIHENFSKKIINRYFYGAKYSNFFVKEVVKKFIEDHKHEHLSERFNLFLSKRQLDLLQKKSKEENINKSEYLRKLIESS